MGYEQLADDVVVAGSGGEVFCIAIAAAARGQVFWVDGNGKRHRLHRLAPRGIEAARLRISRTRGMDCAQVVAIRAFSEER